MTTPTTTRYLGEFSSSKFPFVYGDLESEITWSTLIANTRLKYAGEYLSGVTLGVPLSICVTDAKSGAGVITNPNLHTYQGIRFDVLERAPDMSWLKGEYISTTPYDRGTFHLKRWDLALKEGFNSQQRCAILWCRFFCGAKFSRCFFFQKTGFSTIFPFSISTFRFAFLLQQKCLQKSSHMKMMSQ